MCTVVVRWSPGEPVLLLALRDELVGRDFDDPGEWWPEHPGVVVRHPVGDAVYATVFGQTMRVRPGALGLSWSRTPWLRGTWADGG